MDTNEPQNKVALTLDDLGDFEKSLQAGCTLEQATSSLGVTLPQLEQEFKQLMPKSNFNVWVQQNIAKGKVLLNKAMFKVGMKGNVQALQHFAPLKFYNRTILPSNREDIINLM